MFVNLPNSVAALIEWNLIAKKTKIRKNIGTAVKLAIFWLLVYFIKMICFSSL